MSRTPSALLMQTPSSFYEVAPRETEPLVQGTMPCCYTQQPIQAETVMAIVNGTGGLVSPRVLSLVE